MRARQVAIIAVMAGACIGWVDAAPVSAPSLTGTWISVPNPNYAPPLGPYARAWTEMTWNPLRQEIVIFGGNGEHVYENDIWSLNTSTSTWTNLAPYTLCPGNEGFSQPNGTDDSAFKYDPYNNLYWVFGAASGYRCIDLAPVRTAVTGSGTTKIVDASLAGGTNEAYAQWSVITDNGSALVLSYDAASKTLTLASEIPAMAPGQSYRLIATGSAGVWYFNPTTGIWVGQDTPPGNTGPTPTLVRIAPGVAYSDAAHAFAFYGGMSIGADKQVWKLDVTTKLWTQLPLPAVTPPHLRELLNAFVYDKGNDVFVLFGGVCIYDDVCPEYSLNGDTWVYRLSTNTWQNMHPANPPLARVKHLMAYDDANGVIVLFGGALANNTAANDTWYYHYPSNTWTQVTTSTAPSARYVSQIAHDPIAKQSVIFGGVDTGLLSDIWRIKLTSTSAAGEFDIDGNGAVDALTDGLLLLRYMMGLRGEALIDHAVGASAERNTAPDIESYIAARIHEP